MDGEVGTRLHASDLVTMVFDNEVEFVRFTDFVYARFGGAGLDFTNVPLRHTVRISPDLLKLTRHRFAIRPVTEDEVAVARARFQHRQPFSQETLEDFLGPSPDVKTSEE